MNAIDIYINYTCLRIMRTYHEIEMLKLNAEMRNYMAAEETAKCVNLSEDDGGSILKHFEPDLGVSFRAGNVQRLYQMFANSLVASLAPGSERTVALRKLLESREAALRCSIYR